MRFLFTIFILTNMFACSENNKLILVENNHSDYQIIIPENAGIWERKAADELKRYIEKSTNVILNESNTINNPNKGINIQIDTTAGIKAESIRFETKNGNLIFFSPFRNGVDEEPLAS